MCHEALLFFTWQLKLVPFSPKKWQVTRSLCNQEHLCELKQLLGGNMEKQM
jgi:hypothetical protein